MNDKELNKKLIIESLIWKLFERMGTQGIQLIIQIILARLLSPEDFGTIALVMVFLSLAQVFVQSGFNIALIQNKDVKEVDFSSVLYLSLFIATVLYSGIYFSAPSISFFFNDKMLSLILRVLGLTLFIGAYNSIQVAYIGKKMMFRKLFISSFLAVTISGLIGIFLAYQGRGVWALISQQIIFQIINVIVLHYTIQWRPKLEFSLERIQMLFSFGSKLLISALINVLDMNIRTLVIGRIYSPSMLGFFNRGEQFPKLIVSNIDGSIQSVMLPTFSRYQDNKVILKEMVRKSIMMSSFIVFPLMIGLAVVAESFILVLLTDKWLPAVPFLQLFCLSYAIVPIHTANLQAINALGRSDIFLKLEIFKKTVSIIILLISLRYGVYGITIGILISNLISSLVNVLPNYSLLDYSLSEQLQDVLPSVIISCIMGMFAFSIKYLLQQHLK